MSTAAVDRSTAIPADSIVDVDLHTKASSHREQILEHHFIGELLRHLWRYSSHIGLPEVSHAEVDENGYDVVIEWGGIIRHIQLKSTIGSKGTIRVNSSLVRKPSGCIVLMTCERDLTNVEFLWLGATPGSRFDIPASHKTAKSTRRNREGLKRESLSSVTIPKREFKRLRDIAELAELLFPISLRAATPAGFSQQL